MRRTQRAGFTLIELLIVIVLIGVVSIIALPNVQRIVQRNSVRSARQEVAATLALARASAIHNGRTALFVRSSNTVQAKVRRNGQLLAVGAPVALAQEHKVRVETSSDTITFDPRGFATGIAGAYQTVRLYRGTFADSVCVTRFGRIISEGRCL